MIEILLCGYNIVCHLDNIESKINKPKYNKDVEQLCYYFEGQNAKLPDYCFYTPEIKKPRRRSEF
jgi:hypothetical protein